MRKTFIISYPSDPDAWESGHVARRTFLSLTWLKSGYTQVDLGEGPRALPFFFLPPTLWFRFENGFIKCCLILSSKTLTLLYFASRIRPQCCMLHVLKSEVFIPGGGWETRPTLSEFSGSRPCKRPRPLLKLKVWNVLLFLTSRKRLFDRHYGVVTSPNSLVVQGTKISLGSAGLALHMNKTFKNLKKNAHTL